VRIGVIVSLTEVSEPAEAAGKGGSPGVSAGTLLPGFSCMLVDVLGRSILERTLDRLTAVTHTQPTIIVESPPVAGLFPCGDITPNSSPAAWENAIGGHIISGAHHLLMIRLNTYTDLDFGELLQSHIDSHNSLTRVYGLTGALDIAAVDANSLRDSAATYCQALSRIGLRQKRFLYRGYLKNLGCPRQLRHLVEDGLLGVSGLKPVGIEMRPGVWYGAGARVHSSAMIHAPAFIGMKTHISASCTIDRASAIEHDCVVDYKSTIRQSCLLQNTRIGINLNVRNSIVFNNKLLHLDRGVEIKCSDPRLIGVTSRPAAVSSNLVASLQHRRGFQESVAPTPTKLPAAASVAGTVTGELKVA
jgi:hypothetical protein